jgi:hypothetical protein
MRLHFTAGHIGGALSVLDRPGHRVVVSVLLDKHLRGNISSDELEPQLAVIMHILNEYQNYARFLHI